MQAQPYLFLNGRCEAAVEFYRANLGAEVTMMMRFNEMPTSEGPLLPSGSEHKIMHLSLQIGDTTVMMSDGMGDGEVKFEGFSLSLTVADDAEAKRLFDRLADGGQIHEPLAPMFWTSSFGRVTDRFGVPWMVTVVS